MPTPAAGTKQRCQHPKCPGTGSCSGRQACRGGWAPGHGRSTGWHTPGCPASHREHAALHTPCPDGKGQNPAGLGSITHPRSSAAPAPGTRRPLPKTRGSPRLLQGPSLQCWGHSSCPLPCPTAPMAPTHPGSFPPPPRPDLALGTSLQPLHARPGLGALACWGAVLYCTSLLFLCGTRRGGRGKMRRSRIKPRVSFGRSRAQRAASHPSGTRVGPRLLPLALGLKRCGSTRICPRRSARASQCRSSPTEAPQALHVPSRTQAGAGTVLSATYAAQHPDHTGGTFRVPREPELVATATQREAAAPREAGAAAPRICILTGCFGGRG